MNYKVILFSCISFISFNLSAESLEQWVCDKLSEYNVPDPVKGYFMDEGDYYCYLLGYKHAYKEILDKVRGLEIEELEMAD